MSIHADLSSLPTHKLTILLEHVRLGEAHLRKYLNPQQFSELLQAGELNPEQKQAIQANAIEKEGNAAKTVDGFLTGIIGTWLGYIGFVESKLASLNSFILIVGTATVVGCYAGYYNARQVSAQERDAKVNQRLHNLQYNILKIISAKKAEQISEQTQFLNNALKNLTQDANATLASAKEFEFPKSAASWFEQLSAAMKTHENNHANDGTQAMCKTEVNTALERLNQVLEKNHWLDNKSSPELAKAVEQDTRHYFAALTNPQKITSQEITSKPAWWEGSERELMTGLLPAFLGAFGSIFFYFDGIPKAVKNFGLPWLETLLTNPSARAIEIMLGLLLAVYYVAIFINNQRKAAKRKIEIDASNKHITQAEKIISEQAKKISILKSVCKQVEKIMLITTILNNLQGKQSTQLEPLATA